jgi:hypothetical protein
MFEQELIERGHVKYPKLVWCPHDLQYGVPTISHDLWCPHDLLPTISLYGAPMILL